MTEPVPAHAVDVARLVAELPTAAWEFEAEYRSGVNSIWKRGVDRCAEPPAHYNGWPVRNIRALVYADDAATAITTLSSRAKEAEEALARVTAENARLKECADKATTLMLKAGYRREEVEFALVEQRARAEAAESSLAELRSKFDAAGNYIPHSQLEGDLRAAESQLAEARKDLEKAKPYLSTLRAYDDASDALDRVLSNGGEDGR